MYDLQIIWVEECNKHDKYGKSTWTCMELCGRFSFITLQCVCLGILCNGITGWWLQLNALSPTVEDSLRYEMKVDIIYTNILCLAPFDSYHLSVKGKCWYTIFCQYFHQFRFITQARIEVQNQDSCLQFPGVTSVGQGRSSCTGYFVKLDFLV
jgi:hypothetical protein